MVGKDASGIGVASLLWEAWLVPADSLLRTPGGKYVCPCEAVNVGSVAADFMSWVRDVTADSCGGKDSSEYSSRSGLSSEKIHTIRLPTTLATEGAM